MKLINPLIAVMATAFVGCMAWHSASPQLGQTNIPAWSQVQVGMTRQQVYALMGKPLRATEQVAEWKGAEVKKGWPSDYPSITYWHEYEAHFDSGGCVEGMRDFDKADHQ
jgi:hypothetical protein